MDLSELTLQIILGLLALLVGLAEFTNEGGVFRQAGDVLAEHLAMADSHDVSRTLDAKESVEIGRQQTELPRQVVQSYRERLAFLGLWSWGVPFVRLV